MSFPGEAAHEHSSFGPAAKEPVPDRKGDSRKESERTVPPERHVVTSRVIRNLAAGALGRVAIAAISLITIPFTIRIFGAERYGIVGLASTFLALSSVLDLGVAPTMNRELARLSGLAGSAQTVRDLLRTFETIVWTVAAVIAGAAFLAAPFLISWFNDTHIATEHVRNSLILLGCSVAVQFPVSLYSGGLIGLQEQVWLNAVNVVAVGARSVGGILIIWLVSPTMEAYLLWQIFIPACQTLVLGALLRRHLPAAPKPPRFRLDLIKNLWTMAVGMSGTSILMVMTAQGDKVILSHILPLEQFGYYMIAWSIAARLGLLTDPVVDSIYPHMTEIASRNSAGLGQAYRTGVQMMAMVALPITLTIALFAGDVSAVWTIGAPYADQVAILLTPLILGVAFVQLMDIPMALQWASGRSRPIFLAKLLGMVLLVPGVGIVSAYYGVAAGAWVWPLVNGLLLVGTLPFIHGIIFQAEQWWWWRDVLMAGMAVLAALLLGWLLGPMELGIIERLFRLGLVGLLATIAGVASVPAGRATIMRLARRQI